jgi:hypothetical protein
LPPAAQLEEMYREAMQDVFPQCLAYKERNKLKVFKDFTTL